MANYKQIPLMRGAAQKAYEEKRISLQEFNEVLTTISLVEKRKSQVVDIQTKKISAQMLMRRNNIMHQNSVGLRSNEFRLEN
jgi:hypothetical protein